MRTLPRKNGGFTMVEMLISMTIAMVLLMGAFFSTTETYAVVQQGDARIHTQVHARRTLERLTRNCRYATELAVSGNTLNGWQISITSGTWSDSWVWSWSPDTEILSLNNGEVTEQVVTGLEEFTIDTQSNGTGDICQIVFNWTLKENSGNGNTGLKIELAASTWVRQAAEE